VNFPYPSWPGPGSIVVSFNAEQFVGLDVQVRSDSQLVLAIGDDPQQRFLVTVIPDHAEQIFQICVNAALQVLFAAIGGALDSAVDAADQAVEGAVSEGESGSMYADFEMEDLSTLVEDNASAEEIEEAEAEAGSDAGNALENADEPGYLQQFKSALMANRYKIVLKITEKIVTKIGESLTDIGVALAEHDYDKLPAINPLIDDALHSITWADDAAIRYVGGRVDSAIVFWAAPTAGAKD
jgi:hypothetical protein